MAEAEEEQQGLGVEVGPPGKEGRVAEAEEEQQGLGVEEGPPGKEGRVAEAAKLHLILARKSGKKFETEMKKAMGPIFNRTRNGGDRYDLCIIYNDDVLLHKDQQEEVNAENHQDLGDNEDIPGFPERKIWFEFPERAVRIEQIVALLRAEKSQGISIWDTAEIIGRRRLLTQEEATRVHDEAHWKAIVGLKEMTYNERNAWNQEMFGSDIFACKESSEVARLSAGGFLEAIDRVFKGVQQVGITIC